MERETAEREGFCLFSSDQLFKRLGEREKRSGGQGRGHGAVGEWELSGYFYSR